MRKRITATKENRLFLAGVFGVTERCVFNALSGKTDSEMARKIRKAAMERGAREVSVYEDDEIIYDADGYLRQYFTNGAMLEIKKGTDSGSVYFKDTVTPVSGVNFNNLEEVQSGIKAMR